MRKIPESTKYFKYYNCNPKDNFSSDCVVRAVAGFFDLDWADTVLEMTQIGIKYGYVLNDNECIKKYLKEKGLIKQKEPRLPSNKKMTVRQFIDRNPNISCIANVGSHHLSLILKGKVYDIWDCSDRTMHSFWTL